VFNACTPIFAPGFLTYVKSHPPATFAIFSAVSSLSLLATYLRVRRDNGELGLGPDPYGLASNLELPPDRRFAHGIIDWAIGNRLTARELAMLDLMNTITDQPEWYTGVFDAGTVREWRVDAARNLLISQRTWDWCLEEVRCKADGFRRIGTALVLDAGSRVAKSEPPALRDGALSVLRAAVAEIRPECTWDDVFPSVVNMVYLLYYPLTYGRTRILPDDKRVGRDDIWAYFGKGTTLRLENYRLVEIMVE
jgi:hypothetical protein